MLNRLIIMLVAFSIFLMNSISYAAPSVTRRIPQFSNDKVSVWETVIYPSKSQVLKMHRHEHDRVLVAFDSGVLKITNDKDKVHYLKLEKNKSYYLSKDIPNELHKDENISSYPIKVLLVELKN